LRPQALCTGTSNFFSNVTFAVFLVYAVRTRREGTQVFYRLENEHASRLVADAIGRFRHGARPQAWGAPQMPWRLRK
jgi:hypothetical protein